MKTKYILFLCAAVILIAAGVKYMKSAKGTEELEEYLLPREMRIEDIALISIKSQGNAVTISHQDHWTIDGKAVDDAPIVVFIADLYGAKVHRLSNIPLDRIGLTPDSGATTITLCDSQSNIIATAILGKVTLSSGDNPSPIGRYALKDGKPVLLPTPLLQADYTPAQW